MKITIDTQQDSFEDIRKVMHILGGIIEKRNLGGINSNYGSSSADTSNLMSMFDSQPAKEVPDTAPDFGSFLNLANKTEERKEIKPQVELY